MERSCRPAALASCRAAVGRIAWVLVGTCGKHIVYGSLSSRFEENKYTLISCLQEDMIALTTPSSYTEAL